MTRKILIPIIFFLTASIAYATTVVDLYQSGVGARALGMGKAFTSVDGGANAVSFNPASIAFVQTLEVTTTQTKILNVVDYKMYGGVYATNYGNFGLNYISVYTPAGYVTTSDRNSLVNASTMAYSGSTIMLSAARDMNKLMHMGSNMGHLAVGLNIKMIKNYMSGITNGNASGLDSDVGFLLLSPNNLFNFGVCFQNILRGDIAWDSGNKDKLPPTLRLGMSYKLLSPNILFAMDAENAAIDSRPTLLHTGVEWHANDSLSLRFGVDQSALDTSNVTNNVTYGVGFKLAGMMFDYAYRIDKLQAEASTSYLSLSFSPE